MTTIGWLLLILVALFIIRANDHRTDDSHHRIAKAAAELGWVAGTVGMTKEEVMLELEKVFKDEE
jgi:hypothetical protein